MKTPKFEEDKEDFDSYIERLESYFILEETDADKKVHSLIMGLSSGQYQTLKNLTAPCKPSEKTYSDLVKVLSKHYGGAKNARTERAKFRSVIRDPSESVMDYAVRIKMAARHCEFGDRLDEMLVDQLIQGVRSQTAVTKLLESSEGLNLTFNGAVEIAQQVLLNEQSMPVYERRLVSSEGAGTEGVHKVDVKKEEKPARRCYCCDAIGHFANKCPHKDSVCPKCQKVGHLAVTCRSAKGKGRPTVHAVTSGSDTIREYGLYHINSNSGGQVDLMIADDQRYPVEVLINGCKLTMEIDTGAIVTCVGEDSFSKFRRSSDVVVASGVELSAYGNTNLDLVGVVNVDVSVRGVNMTLPLVVVKGSCVPVLGRNWLRRLNLDLGSELSVNLVQSSAKLDDLFAQHSTVFEPGLGCLKDFEASVTLKPGTTPVYKRARSLPFQKRPLVEAELDRLEQLGVIKPIEHSEWASPIVAVVKSDGKSIRLCADFKETLNPACAMTQYPLPVPEDIFTTLSRGQAFSTLDLSSAYHQLKLSEESQKLLVINTHKGLYAYQRLQFGLHSAVGIFQRAMENVLKDIPGCAVYLDDIIITGSTLAEHRSNLEAVLHRLGEAGLRLNREKCTFLQPEVKYLGHKISAEGVHPLDEKIDSVQSFPTPKDKSEVATFCGMVKYYHRFLPHAASVLAPLYDLQKKDASWRWTQKEMDSFQAAKDLLMSNTLLCHYDPRKKLSLTTDASSYGLGAVLEQECEGGMQPLCYASRTLSPAEKNYSQTEKEGLAVVWAVTKFSKYLLGRTFDVFTDHKPLLGLFGERRGVPVMAAGRIIRWSLTLAAYDYKLIYKPGTRVANADCLSRFPLAVTVNAVDVGEEVQLLEHLTYTQVSAEDLKKWTDRDPLLARVRTYVLSGWDNVESDDELRPYFARKYELSVLNGCVLWGARVVIPPQGRDAVMSELHDTHPGIVRMKALARGYVWWPGMDGELERKVHSCRTCQSVRNVSDKRQPLHPWEYPGKPWSRLHIDYAGPMDGKMFLVVVDAYSKWMDIFPTSGSTSAITIAKLRGLFSTHGLPDLLVSDNATSFTSAEFQEFLQRNGIRHVTGAPYHPATNGLAERAVRVFKEAMVKCRGSLEDKLCRFLFDYRITPHSTTGVPPCELLMKRRLVSRFDRLLPSVDKKVGEMQRRQMQQYRGADKIQEYQLGDVVYFKDFSQSGGPNLLGTVEEITGPVSCKVRSEQGRLYRRHFDQMFKQTKPQDSVTVSGASPVATPVSVPNYVPPVSGQSETVMTDTSVPETELAPAEPAEPTLRRSTRIRKPVDRLNV